MNLNDLDFQVLLESLPLPKSYYNFTDRKEGMLSVTLYQYEVNEIRIEVEEDEFVVFSKKIEKNGSVFDPKSQDQKERQEIENDKKYDVRLNFFGKIYQLNEVTKREIEIFHDQKYNEYKNGVSPSLRGTNEAKWKIPIDWNKDVEFLREYE
ncbi:hypothetical protein [Marinilactibacillus kalidii]|uniref:hypothetical protein n=1 Tax=Marinilactibacillus kalidii TaxID=2820274 RepID=UPI001ABE86AD|nr:hypothetical protein [Marinilactibacillus kalidii]